jgi:hypothetical protein
MQVKCNSIAYAISVKPDEWMDHCMGCLVYQGTRTPEGGIWYTMGKSKNRVIRLIGRIEKSGY